MRALAFHPTGAVLVAGGADNLIRLWDTRNPKEPKAVRLVAREIESEVQTLAFSPDGRLAATAEANGRRVFLWRTVIEIGRAEEELKVRVLLLGTVESGTGPISGLAFDRDSKTLTWAAADGKVGVLSVSLDDWKERAKNIANRELTNEERHLYGLPVAPSGPR